MDAIIIANGTPLSRTLLTALVAQFATIIAADGGANALAHSGIVPSCIIGDGDSITTETRQQFANVPFLLQHSQETTDLEKALQYCLDQGFGTVAIAQALHGEVDHVLGALSACTKFCHRLRIECLDQQNVLKIISAGSHSFAVQPGDCVSLLPLPRAEGIRTLGLEYPLHNENLGLGERDGIRNVALQASVTITLTQGVLGVLFPHHL